MLYINYCGHVVIQINKTIPNPELQKWKHNHLRENHAHLRLDYFWWQLEKKTQVFDFLFPMQYYDSNDNCHQERNNAFP